MSETIAFEAAAAESEYQTPSPDYSESEEENKQWGNELTAIVGANADVIVRCPWMGGADVTLGEAMRAFNWPPNLKAEDEPFLISVVEGLLANRVIETEEPEDEEEPEAESEEEKPLAKETEPKEKPREQKEEKAKEPKLDKNPAVKLAEQKKDRAAEPQTREQKTVERPEPTAKAELRAEPAEAPEPPMAKAPEAKFADKTIAVQPRVIVENSQASGRTMEADPKVDSPHVAEELPVSNIPRETALPQSADSVKKADANPGTTIKEPTEIKLDFGMSAQDIDIAYKPEVKFDNPKQLLRERTDLEEVLTYKVFDDENQRVLPLNPAAELLGESFTAKRTELILEIQAEKEFLFSELEIPESEFEPTSLIELIESGGTEDKELSLDGIYASLDADIEPLAVVEINDVDDQEGETGSATGRLEAVIIKLAERVEVADPDMAEELDEIAQQIIEVPVQPITTDKQEAEIEEEPASTKLAALSYDFAQTLGVELEPVEATSLAHLIIRLKKEGKLPTPSHEKGAVDQGYGTHELLSGLLISLADSRKVTYLSTLGSWTLRLFWHPELVAA